MEDKRLWNLCSKTQIIDELETTLPRFVTKQWNPLYVHILKVGPRKDVNLDSLWNRLGMTESRIASSTKEMTMKMTNFQNTAIKHLDVSGQYHLTALYEALHQCECKV